MAVVLALVLVAVPAAGVMAFTDTAGHWAESIVAEAARAGLISGYPDGTFRPNDPVVQAHFAAILANAGKPVTVDSPAAYTTREEAAKYLVIAQGLEAEANGLSSAATEDLLAGFADRSQIGLAYRRYVATAAKHKLLQGQVQNGATLFNPKANLTRAQAAAVVLRLLGRTQLPGRFTLGAHVGSEACLGCHVKQYEGWRDTAHSMMILDAKGPAVQADFTTFPNPEYKNLLLQAHYVMGIPRQERFLVKLEDGLHYVLPYYWDREAKAWKEYNLATWRARSWEDGCAKCHTVGFAAATRTFADTRIGCENCHGAGREHILARGDPAKITLSFSASVCEPCHGGRPQYQTWKGSAHAKALAAPLTTGHARDYCVTCHSAEGVLARAGQVVTLKDAVHSVECSVCHVMHEKGFTDHAQLRWSREEACTSPCHGGVPATGTFAPGATARRQLPLYSGVGAIGVASIPSFHYTNGVTCVDCHMVPTRQGRYTGSNHSLQVVMPRDAAAAGLIADSCGICHASSPPEVRQRYIDLWQETVSASLFETKQLLDQAQARVKATPAISADLKRLVDTAYTNWTMVSNDGSKGAHNFDYAIVILEKVKQDLQTFLKATGTTQ